MKLRYKDNVNFFFKKFNFIIVTQMEKKVTIDICDKFNLIDARSKCPYTKDTLNDENINEAMNDLKKCFVVCDSTPEVYMFKDYDAIEERPKVSYTSEMIAKQKLKKVIIG